MMKDIFNDRSSVKELTKDDLQLPSFSQGGLESTLSNGELVEVAGTNVVRVPFGIRESRKKRPARSASWATLVLPFQPLGSPTPPPQAA